MRIASGVTDQYVYFVAVDATDFTTRETGLSSFTVYRSRDGGAAAAMTTPTINETDATNMPGVYELLLDEDMTIGSGNLTEAITYHITHAGMAPVTKEIELFAPANYTIGTVTTLTGHTAQTGDSFARIGAAGAGLTALATQASVNTVDTNVDAILVDTGTTIPALLGTPTTSIAADIAAIAPEPQKNVALADIPVYMVDSTDHATPETGLTLTVERSIDGGAFASGTGTAAEIGNGLYQYDASQADMNGNVIIFKFTATGADPYLLSISTRA